MADINQSVQISYTADISELLKEIEKLPGASKEEAQKLTKEISKALKDTEKASKKAAATNSKSMSQMSMSAKRAGQEFKRLKRSASEIGRGLTDLAVIFGDTESPLGEFVNKIGIISVTGGALLPLFASLRTAVIGLGASTAMATGGLSLLAGAAAAMIFSMGESDEAAQKQAKSLETLNKKYNKFRDELEKSIQKNEEFKASVEATQTAIDDFEASAEQKVIELQFELGQISAREFRELVNEAKTDEAFAEIQKNFDEREKALMQQLTNETDLANQAVMNLYNAANAIDFPISTFQTEEIRKYGQISGLLGRTDAQIRTMIDDLYPSLSKQLQTQMFLVAKRAGMEAMANEELNKFTKERTDNEKIQRAIITEKLNLEEKLWWQGQQTNDAKDKQGEIIARNLAHQERLLKIQNEITNSVQNQRNMRLSLLDKDLQQSKTLAEFQAIIAEKHALQIEQLKLEKIAKMDLMNANLAQAQSVDEIVAAHQLNAEIVKEVGLIEQEMANLKITNLQKIQQEERRLQELQLQGSRMAFENIKSVYDTQFDMIKNNFNAEKKAFDEQEQARAKQAEAEGRVYNARSFFATKAGQDEAKAVEKAFRMQQAFAVAKIAMDAAGGAVNALATYGPVLGPILAGTIAASAAAQTAVVLNQQGPTASAHMGQPMAPDERAIRVLTGEAVIDRRTVQSLGGEQGIRSMQQGSMPGSEVIVLNTFKHFDKYNKSARRQMGSKRRGSGAY